MERGVWRGTRGDGMKEISAERREESTGTYSILMNGSDGLGVLVDEQLRCRTQTNILLSAAKKKHQHFISFIHPTAKICKAK